jgi:hypothetical protein
MESLIAIVLTFIIATGLCYAMARVLQAQRYQTTQHAVLSEIARQLSMTGVSSLCSTSAGLTLSIHTNLASVSTDVPMCARLAVSVTPAQTNTALSKTIGANQVYTSVLIVAPSSSMLGGGSGLSVRL